MAEAKKRKRNRLPGVFKRGESWAYKLSYTDEVGRYRQQWRTGFETQQLAWEAKAEALAERNRGADLTPAKTTVEQYLRRWLRDYAEGLPGATTYEGYKGIFERHVIPVIGRVLLKKLRPLQVQSVYTGMRKKGLSEKTILNCHRPLSEALKHAVDWELVNRNVATSAKKPKPTKYEPVIMPIEQIRETLTLGNDGTTGGAVVRFAIYGGMRQGELRRLKRDHIDFEHSMVSIPKGKTKTSSRGLSMTPDGMEILREQLKRVAAAKLLLGPAYKDDGYVFAQANGEQMTAGDCNWPWNKIRRKVGTAARFHDLRHAHASLLLKMGVHPKVVQERLGHSSIQVTIDLYSHVMPGIHDAAVLPLDGVLGAVETRIEEVQ